MKTNKFLLPSLAIILGAAIASGAYATSGSADINTNINAHLSDDSTEVTSETDTHGSVDMENKNTNDDSKLDDNNKTDVEESSDDTQDDSSKMEDGHRSAVALFVQSLLKIADRDRGIGADVKVIAQSQNDSEQKTDEALAKIKHRSALKTFFVGTDYKSLGTLRSEITTTTNAINQLKKIEEKTTDASIKAELKAQIQILEQEQIKLEAFITANENKFSLFGWLIKK